MYLTRESYFKHYGVPGMKWGHRKSSARSSQQFKNDLLSDRNPRNVDAPVHKNDRATGDGTASNGSFYQRYVTRDNYLYVKYSNGDKRYSNRPGPSNTPLKLMRASRGASTKSAQHDSRVALGKKVAVNTLKTAGVLTLSTIIASSMVAAGAAYILHDLPSPRPELPRDPTVNNFLKGLNEAMAEGAAKDAARNARK